MNSIIIDYDNSSYKNLYPAKDVRAFLNKVLKDVNLNNVEFSVSFVTEEHIHKLNKDYRDIDRSTDILSFAVEDDTDVDFILPGEEKRNLGDMLICPEVMNANAEYFNVSESEELKRLLIHGVLHLSGENHNTNDATEPMLIHQEEILKRLNFWLRLKSVSNIVGNVTDIVGIYFSNRINYSNYNVVFRLF